MKQRLEGQANLNFLRGLSLHLNATYNKVTYAGSQAVNCASNTTGCNASTPQLAVTTPSGVIMLTVTFGPAASVSYPEST